MRTTFPTREQLQGMSLAQLRLIDIQDTDEEVLLQEIISAKVVEIPPIAKVYKGDFPDIKTPEEEAKYQAIVNERAGISTGSTESRTEAVPITGPIVEPALQPEILGEAAKPVFKCDECGKEVKTAGALRMHKGRFHKK